jgi:hypothetical protein
MDILATAVAFVHPIFELSSHKSCCDGNILPIFSCSHENISPLLEQRLVLQL